MANEEHLHILMEQLRQRQGVEKWNQWKSAHPDIQLDFSGDDSGYPDRAFLKYSPSRSHGGLNNVDLTSVNLEKTLLAGLRLERANFSGANLSGANLSGATLSGAILSGATLRDTNLSSADLSGANLRDTNTNLSGANFSGADLSGADLRGATLSNATLSNATLSNANLSGAHLSGADLSGANFSGADLSGADLSGADLRRATLVGTNFAKATLTNCKIYGIAAWSVELKGAIQNNLVITPEEEPTITVDNLKIAQFIYLLLNNAEIRNVIDTITSKVVLILGRFTDERKAVLDLIRDELRKRNYSPVLFDFEKPTSQTMAETISTLAHLARFIIVDLTDPRSVPAELATIVPNCHVPVQPLLEVSSLVVEEKVTGKHVVEENTVKGKIYSLFPSLRLFPWVLPELPYQNTDDLLISFKERVLDPAEQKAKELIKQK